jgi:Spy/CpxP family protein refolding chaperone
MKRHLHSKLLPGLAALAFGCAVSAQPMPPKGTPGEPGPGMERGHAGPGEHGGVRGGHGGQGPGMGEHGMPFLHGLQLSEAQQDRVFAILHAQAPAQRELEKKIRAAHEALRALGANGQFDEAKASAQAQSLGQAVAAEALLRERTHAQLFAVLTPEQREQAARRREQRTGRP